MNRTRAFCSVSGSFSRIELLVAGLFLLAVFTLLVVIKHLLPALISDGVSGILMLALYAMWGIALGKRSRDLGTTFTYGLILGTLIPIIGILFLFQAGKKFRDAQSPVPTEASRPPFGNQPYA